ncbi:MAG: tRNA (adenosine(37)-N6)-threonylcarbamoyltransferase complex ATPase subunit type 1 TsaE [Candidatus Kapaibacteriota bacterium]
MIVKTTTKSEIETEQLGFEFAKSLVPGDKIALYGDLGSGKTEFVKGICNYFQVEEIVTSPTFTIVNKYTSTLDDTPFYIYHIDLYRIEKETELVEIGFSEYLNDVNAITIIEWAEKTSYDFSKSIKIQISTDEENDNIRHFQFELPREMNFGV